MRTLATYPLEATQIVKRYGEVAALRGASLRVATGSACGLVGPNGAGKSTFLRIACGLARPDAGQVRVDEADPFLDPVAARRSLGCVPEIPPLFELLTGIEQLLWVGRVRGVPDPLLTERIRELCAALQLDEALHRRISTYSKGMRQKLAFVAALVHDPRILVLDEPFDGVDPLATRAMKAVIRQFVDAGAAVLLSSHLLPLVEDLCDTFAVISEGRVVFQGDRQALAIEAARAPLGADSGGRNLEPVFWSLAVPDARPLSLETVARVRRESGDAAAIDR